MSNYLETEICIVGLGPSGIGAALKLSKSKLSNKIVYVDAGELPENRLCSSLITGECKKDLPCQIISGFGGCSLLSGGKISLYPAGSKMADILGSNNLATQKMSEALTLLEEHLPLFKSNVENIDNINELKDKYSQYGFLLKYYDVYQFNLEDLQKAYLKIYNNLLETGVLLLESKLIDVGKTKEGFKLKLFQKGNVINVLTKKLLIGIGRYNHNLLFKLNSKFDLSGDISKIELGVRLEFPVEVFPRINEIHGDLKLIFNNNNSKTYCVCQNGKTIAFFNNEIFLTEGNYNRLRKTNFINLAILTKFDAINNNSLIIDEVINRSKILFNGFPCYQSFESLINNTIENQNDLPRTLLLAKPGNILGLFPEDIAKEIKTSIIYFISKLIPKSDWNKIIVYSPEIDFNGLVFPVKSNFSIIPDFYIIGSCTGLFRGILQSFCSGIICGESIIGELNERY